MKSENSVGNPKKSRGFSKSQWITAIVVLLFCLAAAAIAAVVHNNYRKENSHIAEGTYPADYYKVRGSVFNRAGKFIPEGEYLLYADHEYFTDINIRLYKDTYGNEVEPYAWLGTDYSRYVLVEEGQCIELDNCTAYDTDIYTLEENNPFEHPGMFKVGVDLEAGTYNIVSYYDNINDYYYYITDDLKELNSMGEFDGTFSDGVPTEITVKDGDYILLGHCILEETGE